MMALEADVGPYRLRHGEDAAWPPRDRAYGGEAQGDLLKRHARPIRIATRLAVPVLLLVTLLGAAYLYTDAYLQLAGAPVMIQRALLAVSDLILPMAWTAIHLTNRRYGAPYAFGQLVAGLAVIITVALINPWNISNWIASAPALSWRAMVAFTMAFLFANFTAIIAFDAFRGPRWWSAPLVASFAASLVFSAVYYPAAFAGGAQV
ncbi:MAG: VUT family protein, partial [Rubrivivax sp.]